LLTLRVRRQANIGHFPFIIFHFPFEGVLFMRFLTYKPNDENQMENEK